MYVCDLYKKRPREGVPLYFELMERRDSETRVLRFYRYGPPGPQMPGMKEVHSDEKRKFFPDIC